MLNDWIVLGDFVFVDEYVECCGGYCFGCWIDGEECVFVDCWVGCEFGCVVVFGEDCVVVFDDGDCEVGYVLFLCGGCDVCVEGVF